MPEQMGMELHERRPFVAARSPSRQQEQVGRGFHRAEAGNLEESPGLFGPDDLGADDSEVEIEVVSDEVRPGTPGRLQELVQDLGKLPPLPRRPGVRDPVDRRRVGRDPESAGFDDMAGDRFRLAAGIESVDRP